RPAGELAAAPQGGRSTGGHRGRVGPLSPHHVARPGRPTHRRPRLPGARRGRSDDRGKRKGLPRNVVHVERRTGTIHTSSTDESVSTSAVTRTRTVREQRTLRIIPHRDPMTPPRSRPARGFPPATRIRLVPAAVHHCFTDIADIRLTDR